MSDGVGVAIRRSAERPRRCRDSCLACAGGIDARPPRQLGRCRRASRRRRERHRRGRRADREYVDRSRANHFRRSPLADVSDPADYCREVEAYLCRKNDGHLIRIVGPAFEQVCGWATRGIPVKIVFRGIDRYFERYYAKGPRRRPVRVEFCESDVLDVFDDWRRAVGVGTAAAPSDGGSADEDRGAAPRRGSLSAHLERVIARLTALRAGADRSLDSTVDEIVRELDAARAGSKGLRGKWREALL